MTPNETYAWIVFAAIWFFVVFIPYLRRGSDD